MKKRLNGKRLLSLFLAVVMVIGLMFTGNEAKATETSDTTEYNEVEVSFSHYSATYDYVYLNATIVSGPDVDKGTVANAYGSWGIGAYGENVAYVKGDESGVHGAGWDVDSGYLIIWSNLFYNYIDELSEISFSAGTILTPTAEKTNTTPIKLVNGLKLVRNTENAWEVAVDYNNVEVSYSHTDADYIYLKAEIVSGPNQGKSISEAYGNWGITAVVESLSYVMGTESGTKTVVWNSYETSDGTSYLLISGNFITNNINNAELTELSFEADTILPSTTDNNHTNATPIKLLNGLKLIRDTEGAWMLAENVVQVSFSHYDFTNNYVYMYADIISGPDADKTVAEAYGDWGIGAMANLNYVKGEENNAVSAGWDTIKNTEYIIIWSGVFNSSISELTEISFPTGTQLAPADEKTNTTPIRLANGLRIVRDENNVWVTAMNEITLSYSHISGNNLYFAASITGGADKGESLGSVYGLWPQFKMGDTVVYGYPCEANRICIQNYQKYINVESLDDLTEIVLPLDSVFSPTELNPDLTPIRLSSGVKIVKDDGTWMPAENKVKISKGYFEADGSTLYLNAEIIDGPDKNRSISEVYGDWLAQFKMKNGSRYAYVVEGNRIAIQGFGTVEELSEITFDAGSLFVPTLLKPEVTPIRIANDLKLAKADDGTWKEYNTKMLDIMVQDNSETAVEGAEKFDLRFISSIHNPDEYEKAGFVFSTKYDEPTIDTTGCATRYTTKLYTSMMANGTAKAVQDVYDTYSNYMFAFEIKNVPATTTLYVRSFVIDKEGNPTYGDTRIVAGSNVISGKEMIWLGSSITYGYDGYSIVDVIEDMYSDTECYKYAVSGTTLVTLNDDPASYVARMEKIDKAITPDVFMAQLSTNDASLGYNLGTVSDSFDKSTFDKTTVAGSIEYMIAYIEETWNCPIVFYTSTYYDNATYDEMVTLLQSIKEKWNTSTEVDVTVDILDLWNDDEMTATLQDEVLYAKYKADNIHLTISGYREWWTPKYVEYFVDLWK